jgi:putative hydrolase of the HAD superfamily
MISSAFRAVLFDFDGIIVDTEWAIYETWHQTFLEHGHALPLEVYNQCIGTDFNTWSPKAHLEELTGASLDWHHIDDGRQERIERTLAGSPPMPGIPEALAAATRAGLTLAVVSSSSHDWVDGWLERIELADRFALTVCRGDAERIKPAPDLYLEAARQLGLEPSTCLVIEDSVNGIKAAAAAGMTSIAIPNRVTACSDFSIASRVLSSAADLAGLLADPEA